ncbi:GIY-YIG nuclease family protein [Thalassotalea crassostreae]|uniref:GIY-YIG nuclease family protein n=1 Tax=Thalassotalea crassostreae TaxID=1763536 RepID=UPI00083887C3|nr:GIY-YIG nuclease family protein [Thalassotalea crassostreae]
MNKAAIYILTNKPNGTLYIGATSNLENRIDQHRFKVTGSFSKRYNLDKLVYFELFDTFYDALTREKQLKNWRRQWKINLIEKVNPHWDDLCNTLI